MSLLHMAEKPFFRWEKATPIPSCNLRPKDGGTQKRAAACRASQIIVGFLEDTSVPFDQFIDYGMFFPFGLRPEGSTNHYQMHR